MAARPAADATWYRVGPYWQYAQSKEQILAVVDEIFIPNEAPRRRDAMGPYIIRRCNSKKDMFL
jgi:hypothetical protein